jgi:hypothetical protein
MNRDAPLPWWLRMIVVLGIVLLMAGALVSLLNPALLVAPGAEMTAAVRVYAGYTFSRDLALAIMLLAAFGWRSRNILNGLLLLTGLIQLLDVIPDLLEQRYVIVPGVLILAGLFFAAAARLSGAAFWKLRA